MNLKHFFWVIFLAICSFQLAFATTPIQLLEKGEALATQGKHTEAIKIFERMLESEIKDNYQMARVHYGMGLSYSKLGDRVKSIENYSTSINYYPKEPLTYLNRGNDFYLEDKYLKAVDDFNKAIDLDDKLFLAYNSRGIAYLKLKEFDRALSDLNSAIQLNPKYVKPYKNRAKVYFETKKFDLALSDIEIAIEMGTKEAWPYNMAAWIYAASPDPSLRNGERAVKYAEQAVLLQKDSQSLDTLAAAYAEVGKFDLAVLNQEMAIRAISRPDDQSTLLRYKERLESYKQKIPWRDEALLGDTN